MRKSSLLAAPALVFLFIGCKKPSRTTEPTLQPKTEQTAWKTYEDSRIKFEYPPGWDFSPIGLDEKKPKSIDWIILPPGSIKRQMAPLIGTMGITGFFPSQHHESLSEVFKKHYGDEGTVLGRPVKLRLGKAECIAGKIAWKKPQPMCEPDKLGRKQICLRHSLMATCYDSARNFYYFSATTGIYPPGSPDKQAVEYSRIAEHFLKSIRIK